MFADGGTPLAEAVLKTINMIGRRLREIEAADIDAFRPWLYLLTDGEPTSPRRLLREAQKRIRQVEDEGRIGFFAVGTADADMDFLRWLAVRPPCRIRDMDYGAMFRWVAKSVLQVSHSMVGDHVEPPDPAQFGLRQR
jgi:uncharacterized protein YegL